MPPLPPPSPQPSSKPEVGTTTEPVVSSPELEVRIEPSIIQSGESALLSWETRNTDQVLISRNIGSVGTSGKIKLFPEETTTYTVTAKGSGGETSESVTVEVIAPDRARLSATDLHPESLEERFNDSVKPVFFELDAAELSEKARLTLAGNILWLKKMENAHLRFLIQGHCDERGTEEYNLALGDKRAEVVSKYIVDGGIDASRIAVLSLGEERPFDPRPTEAAWALNRRAQFVLIQD